MRRFIINILLFSIPILCVGLLMELLLRNIPNDYNYKKTYLDNNSNKIQTLFLGSSHTFYGINPVYISTNSFNASHISQSINYDFEIFFKYEKKWSNLKTIVIPIDYFSLLSRTETGQEYWRIKNYNIYYHLKSSNNLSDYYEILSVKLKSNLIRLYSYYMLNQSEITCNRLGYGNMNLKNKNLEKTGEIAAKRHTKSNFSYYKKNIELITTFLAYTSKNGINVIFYTSPAYHTYTLHLNKKQLLLTTKVINKLADNFDNCTYYNLLNDCSFTKIDYRDADHLNKKGAKKLSNKLDSLITFSAKSK